MTALPMFTKDDSFRPFSNGHEYEMWIGSNCGRGEKGCRKYRPMATSSRDGCPIEVAVAMGSCSDGKIPARIGLRGGWLVEGPNGTLVPVEPGVIPACPEYRGYDEPDDRPRRGPTPPEGQLDLLDPRNVPSPMGGVEEPSSTADAKRPLHGPSPPSLLMGGLELHGEGTG